MQKRIRLTTLLICCMAMLCLFLALMRGMNNTVKYLDAQTYSLQMQRVTLASEQSDLQAELAIKDTDTYIRDTARALYGYLLPGEIRFVVVNPEVLYDAPEAAVAEPENLPEGNEAE